MKKTEPLELIQIIQKAKKAQSNWAILAWSERKVFLQKLSDLIQENAAALCDRESSVLQIPADFIMQEDIQAGKAVFDHYLHKGPCESVATGIIGIILPWTFSFRLLLERLAPALYYGNALIIKMSPLNAELGDILVNLVSQAQFPEDLINIVHGDEELGQFMAGHPGIPAISFVGRQETLSRVLEAAVARQKKLHLSGGAKNAAIVLADFDFNMMPRLVQSCYLGFGQLCWNIPRIYVVDSIYQDFLQAFKQEVGKVQDQTWGRFPDEEHKNQFFDKWKIILEEKAKVLCDGKLKAVMDLPNCSIYQQDEVHGPFVSITSVKYAHDAVKWANTGYLGVAAQVWSQDIEKATRLAQKIEAGTVWINSWLEKGVAASAFKQSQYAFSESQFYSDHRQIFV